VLLQSGGLQIAAGLALGKTLVEEMMAMEVRVSPAGNEQYAAWRGGTHDDLVFAVALAYWSAARAFPEGARGTARWWSREDGLGLERLVEGAVNLQVSPFVCFG
jgi:hypothetical protein